MTTEHDETLAVGVIGVGAMGEHHARVYDELRGCQLVGVADDDESRAKEIAMEYGTDWLDTDELIEKADAVTIAVPTQYHYDLARKCIDTGTNILIEKPIVEDKERGEELLERAADADVTLQVGHIERFNPVTQTLQEIVPDLNVVSVNARRLGPQPDRKISDTAVTDLMIHDIDLICTILNQDVSTVTAMGNTGGRFATATLKLEDGVIGKLTASRMTQRKVRELTITAENCYVVVDYIDQDIQIHRNSAPEYVVDEGDMRYRHESIIENPAVDSGEPLKYELQSFVTAIRDGTEPEVTGEDGMQALELAKEINQKAFGSKHKVVEVLHD